MVGVAVKVTDPPAQIFVADDEMDTAGFTDAEATFIALDVAEDVVVHDALLAITTVTTSLLFKVFVVKPDAVCPDTEVPLTNH